MKKILLVIDYQNDFVDGALGFPKAVVLEDAIAEKIGQYRKNGDEVAFTFDTHTEDYLNTRRVETFRFLTVSKEQKDGICMGK